MITLVYEWRDENILFCLIDHCTPQDVRCDPVTGGRILMEHVYLGCILEKVQPETRKKKKTKTTNKQERYQPLEEKKNKRNVEFSYIALFKVPFWKVCFKQAEINAEAVGLSSCWTPEAEDAYSHIRTHIALILHLVLINTNRAYLHRASLQISHVQSHLCFMVQGILCYCLQSCSIVW